MLQFDGILPLSYLHMIRNFLFTHHKVGCRAGRGKAQVCRYTVGTESIQTPLNFSLFVSLQPFAKIKKVNKLGRFIHPSS